MNYYYTLHGYPINFNLHWVIYCIAAAPDPARDYWCAIRSIETQTTKLRLNQPSTVYHHNLESFFSSSFVHTWILFTDIWLLSGY